MYELRFSADLPQLRKNFTATQAINESDVIRGILSQPSPPGTQEFIDIIIPGVDINATYYFAIRAWDELNNAGGLSNVVSVYRRLPPQEEPGEEESTTPSSGQISLAAIFGVCIGLISLLAVVALVWSLVLCVRNGRNRTERDSSHGNDNYYANVASSHGNDNDYANVASSHGNDNDYVNVA